MFQNSGTAASGIMSLFVALLSCFSKSLSAGFFQHSEWFLSRKVEKSGNLSRRRQGACASWHDARPERAERRSPISAFTGVRSALSDRESGCFSSTKNQYHELLRNQASNAPRKQGKRITSEPSSYQ